jgi:hypothetical protein
VLELSSLLVERQPRGQCGCRCRCALSLAPAAEDVGFTTRYVAAATRAAALPSAPEPVLIGVCRGLATLLQAFALSHAHRARVSAFALRQYPVSARVLVLQRALRDRNSRPTS